MAKKKKIARRKKVTSRKKTAKRKSIGKKGTVKKRKPAARKPGKKAAKSKPRGPKLPDEPVGRVTHYFPHVKAAAVLIERDALKAGDTLYFKGHTTHFKQKVESLQINHQPVSQAGPGEEVGIRVRSRTREHDLVFKL